MSTFHSVLSHYGHRNQANLTEVDTDAELLLRMLVHLRYGFEMLRSKVVSLSF